MSSHDPKRRALGKGLESLLPSRQAVAPPTSPTVAPVEAASGKPREIPVDALDRNPFQSRSTFD